MRIATHMGIKVGIRLTRVAIYAWNKNHNQYGKYL